jgi:hypothetical protein
MGGVQAELSLLPTEEGGKKIPMRSGYRGLVRFIENDDGFDGLGAEVSLKREELRPGERCGVSFTFLFPEHVPEIVPGMAFELLEGAKVIGRGTITGTLT